MGLDMWLNSTSGREIKYWRKSNAIHKWFEDTCAGGNLENCEEVPVSKENIIDLRDRCKAVVETRSANMSAEKLPTQEGFFFGDTKYNDYYYQDIADTLEMCEELLNDFDFEHDSLVYCAWW